MPDHRDDTRELRWRATPYFPDAICDVCLAERNVRIGSIPVVLADGRPWPGMTRMWSLCDSCHALGSGLISIVSVEGMLIYLSVRIVDGNILRQFVFSPLVFRDRLC